MNLNLSRRQALLAISATALPVSAPTFASTPKFPTRPVHLVTWVSAGSNNDVLVRLLANQLANRWKQSTVVENRVGAVGIIGTAYAAKAAPDGYTLLVTSTGAQILNALLKAKLPYDPVKDFEPVALITSGVYVFVVSANSPYRTIQEFAQGTKSNPKGLTFGSWGPGSAPHLMGENLSKQVPGNLLHVPYMGEMAVSTDLQGGVIDAGWVAQATARSMMEAGRLRPLAVTGSRRNKALPDVPTFAEAGFKNFEMTGWNAVYAPAGTPPDIVKRVSRDFIDALKAPEVVARVEAMGLDVVGMGPEEFKAFYAADRARWAQVVEASGLKPE